MQSYAHVLPRRPTLYTAASIARAERRLARLERISEVGMQLIEQVGSHAAAAGAAMNEDRKDNPARAFAMLSRAVRLTLAMEARVDRQILAMRKGGPAIPEVRPVLAADRRRRPLAVDDAAPEDGEERRARGELRESLIDRESLQRFGSLTSAIPLGTRAAPPHGLWAPPAAAAADETGRSSVGHAANHPRIEARFEDRPTPPHRDLARPPPLGWRVE